MSESRNPLLSLSVVSHGHKPFVLKLLANLAALGRTDFELVLTINVEEAYEGESLSVPFPVKVIRNAHPKGFARNHNSAFHASSGDYFVVLNPDIELVGDPFSPLLKLAQENDRAICAPTVLNEHGEREDSARLYPTPVRLVTKLFRKLLGLPVEAEPVPEHGDMLLPDWVAGMFILVPRTTYAALGGFDERYHMYYEDVDFCARARIAGFEILVSRDAKIIHRARRDSHRNLRYFVWHLRSIVRFFVSPTFMRIWLRPR